MYGSGGIALIIRISAEFFDIRVRGDVCNSNTLRVLYCCLNIVKLDLVKDF